MCAYNIGSFSRGLLAFFAVTPKHESVGQAENSVLQVERLLPLFLVERRSDVCPTALQLPVFGQQILNTVSVEVV